MYLTGVLIEGLEYVRLYFPRVAITTYAFLRRQYLNYLSN